MASYGEDKTPVVVPKGRDTKMLFDLDELLHNPDKMKKYLTIGAGVLLVALLLLKRK